MSSRALLHPASPGYHKPPIVSTPCAQITGRREPENRPPGRARVSPGGRGPGLIFARLTRPRAPQGTGQPPTIAPVGEPWKPPHGGPCADPATDTQQAKARDHKGGGPPQHTPRAGGGPSWPQPVGAGHQGPRPGEAGGGSAAAWTTEQSAPPGPGAGRSDAAARPIGARCCMERSTTDAQGRPPPPGQPRRGAPPWRAGARQGGRHGAAYGQRSQSRGKPGRGPAGPPAQARTQEQPRARRGPWTARRLASGHQGSSHHQGRPEGGQRAGGPGADPGRVMPDSLGTSPGGHMVPWHGHTTGRSTPLWTAPQRTQPSPSGTR
uniref:Uncharacterized protein n=1 Tax=uncultured prokaryote TaxID=198431 RepID=A0A0H5Q8Y1_9ZZZZ|nr:hypothetical protein [uncultured prokaryote]